MKILSINKELTETKYPSVVFDTDIEGSNELIRYTKIDDLKLSFADYKLTVTPSNESYKITNESIDRIIKQVEKQESRIKSISDASETIKTDYMQEISKETGYDII